MVWAGCGVVFVGLMAWFLYALWYQPKPPIYLVIAPPHAWQAITDSQKNGILVLLKDQLELSLNRTVLLSPLPDQVPVLKVEVGGRGDNGQLGLELNMTYKNKTWSFSSGNMNPKETMHAALEVLGVDAPDLNLLPGKSQNFWLLVSATGHGLEDIPSPFQEALVRASRQESGCAGIHASLGRLIHQGLKRSANSADLQAQWEAERHYQQALSIIPAYPRASGGYAVFKSDCGQTVEAMELVKESLRSHSACGELYQMMSRPTRISGLLKGARNSLERSEKVFRQPFYPSLWVETTYLYDDRWNVFEESLSKGSEGNPERDFYRGYISLLKGNQNRALIFFVKAQKSAFPQSPFAQLSSVFESHLTGQQAEALQLLRKLALQRQGLRALDGELSLRFAEAFGLLNQPNEAFALLEKAFAQGFSCGPWLAQSPMLISLPRDARWENLALRVEERRCYISKLFQGEWFSQP